MCQVTDPIIDVSRRCRLRCVPQKPSDPQSVYAEEESAVTSQDSRALAAVAQRASRIQVWFLQGGSHPRHLWVVQLRLLGVCREHGRTSKAGERGDDAARSA